MNSIFEKFKGKKFIIKRTESKEKFNKSILIDIKVVGFVKNEPNILVCVLNNKKGVLGTRGLTGLEYIADEFIDEFKDNTNINIIYINYIRLEKYKVKERAVSKIFKDIGVIDDIF